MNPVLFLEVGGLLAGLALAAILARQTRQSPIPFFILFGLFLNPPREAAEVVDFMAVLGVSLLLFLIGLEFTPGSLVRDPRRVAAGSAVDVLLNLGVGVILARLLSLSWLDLSSWAVWSTCRARGSSPAASSRTGAAPTGRPSPC